MAVKFNLPLQDPRSYVKQVSLPVRSQVGVRIQARTETVYNPCEPSRNEIRRLNYNRRLHQLTLEGFQSPIWKPYHGIGDPVYLDDRQLILDTLGLAEKDQKKDESGDENDEIASQKTTARMGSTVNPSKYMQRRMRRGLVNLKAELRHSENVGRYVRIGQSFFDILQKEKDQKLDDEMKARLNEELRLRTEIQPPKYESSSEEEYEEFDETLLRLDQQQNTSASPDVDAQSQDSTRISSTMSAFVRRKRRKINPRPYTPIHCNIGLPTNEVKNNLEFLMQSIFRQLCCLHWFLEAMNIEPPNIMRQISTCWNIKQLGNAKLNAKARESIKDANQNWERFVMQPKIKVTTSRKERNSRGNISGPNWTWSSKRPSVIGSRRAGFWTSRSAVTHRSGTAGSQSVSRASSPTLVPAADEEPPSTSGIEDQTDDRATVSARRPDHYSSEFDLTRSDAQSVVSTASSRRRSKFAIPLDLDVSKLSRKKISELSRIVGAELEKQPDFYTEKREFRSMKLGSQTARPASAPATNDSRQFPSNKWTNMVQDMRLKYDLVAEEKAIDLQDRLEHMERHRIKVCTNKFLALPNSGAPHRAIQEMRARGRYETSGLDSSKGKGSEYSAWYTELLKNIPSRVQSIWFIKAILKRLNTFAIVQSSKHRVLKFTKVLQTLNDWEICSPDVCAAIEFVREKVVDMTTEEFEEWFQESFPHVERPSLPTIRISTQVEVVETETARDFMSSNPENELSNTTDN